MCLSPILIKNVNCGNKSKLSYIADSTSQYIPVPCGHCSVCLALKQQYIVQRVQMESLNHDLFFGTLTYNNDSLPYIEKGGFRLPYVDISDWQKMLKMIRKYEDLPSFKYFLVTEYGGRRHRPHIHFILSFPKDKKQLLSERRSFELKLYRIFLKYWQRNYGSTRKPIWKPLCTFYRNRNSYNYDLHYLDPNLSSKGLDDVAFYASKYCLKYDKWLDKLKSKLYYNLEESDFVDIWDKLRPRRLISKGFGSPLDPDVINHICKGIEFALNDSSAMYPYFISPVNGQTFPLSPYYSSKFLTLSQLEVFNSRKPTLNDSDMMLDSTPRLSPDEALRKQYQFDYVSAHLENLHTYFDDDFNFDTYDGKNLETIQLHQNTSSGWEDFVNTSDFDQ